MAEYPTAHNNSAMASADDASMGAASAPPMDELQYPMLHELLRANDADSGRNSEAQVATVLSPLNMNCPLCEQDVTVVTDKPVVLLPCGHAYHASCGRTFLGRPEGKECTVSTCHRTEQQVEVTQLQRIVGAAVKRGEFKMEDLEDPVLRRDIMTRVRDLLESAQRSGDASQISSKSGTAPSADADLCSEEAYRVQWLKTRVGREGFSFMQKAKLLSPYMKNPLAVKRETLSMARLYQLEDKLRSDARDEAEGDAGGIAVHVEPAVDNSEDMKSRISVKRFVSAGLTLSDIYFGLDLRGWQPLCDAGFEKGFITGSAGNFSLTELTNLYAIDYKSLTEIGWDINDIVHAGHSAQELSNIGLGFNEMWVDMAMTKDDLGDLGFSPKEWHDVLGLDKKYLERPLGIGAMDLKLARWSENEFIKVFDLHPIEQRALGLNGVSGPVAAPPTRVEAGPSAKYVNAPKHVQQSQKKTRHRVGTPVGRKNGTGVPVLHRPSKAVPTVLTLARGRT